ncbi:MAG: hypothetical protein U1F67_24525 [Rubrivivax sp.]
MLVAGHEQGHQAESGFFSQALTLRRMLSRLLAMSAETRMFWMPSWPQMRAMLRRARSVTMPQS